MNDVDIAEAHQARYLAKFEIPPRSTQFDYRHPTQGIIIGGRHTIFDHDSGDPRQGCVVNVPIGLILVPDGATTVTIPAGHDFTVAETECGTEQGQGRHVYQNHLLENVGSVTVTVSDSLNTFYTTHSHNDGDSNYVPRPSGDDSDDSRRGGSVATGITGTGFYCGQHYAWRDIEPDAEFPMFMTAARRSLIGWVYVDSSGHQVARCTGHRSIYRPADLYEGGAPE